MKTMSKILLISAVCTALGIVASHQPLVQKAFGTQARTVASWTKNAKEGETGITPEQRRRNTSTGHGSG